MIPSALGEAGSTGASASRASARSRAAAERLADARRAGTSQELAEQLPRGHRVLVHEPVDDVQAQADAGQGRAEPVVQVAAQPLALVLDDADDPAPRLLYCFETADDGRTVVAPSLFRRSDGGQVLHNAFVENNILDSFNTEIGAEAYVRTGPWLAMLGVTDGQNKGGILAPEQRGPAFLGKVGFDQQINPLVRVRLTGSGYKVNKTTSAALFGGDRTGSHYFFVLENTQATSAAQFTSGRLNPGLSNSLTAWQINPFVKVAGLELFGVIEKADNLKAIGRAGAVKTEGPVGSAALRWTAPPGGDDPCARPGAQLIRVTLDAVSVGDPASELELLIGLEPPGPGHCGVGPLASLAAMAGARSRSID